MVHSFIAPCGMNCGICLAYIRTKNVCPGCQVDDPKKSSSCSNCIIKSLLQNAVTVFTICDSDDFSAKELVK